MAGSSMEGVLRLRYGGLSGELEEVIRLLHRRELRTLELRAVSLGPPSLSTLLPALRSNERLLSLELGGNPLGDEGVGALVGAMGEMPGLTVLALDSVGITDRAGTQLAAALATGRPDLHVLRLQHNALADESASTMADALRRGAPSLRDLCLQRNSISNTGAAALLDTLEELKRGLALDLRFNLVTRSALLDRIAEACEPRVVRTTCEFTVDGCGSVAPSGLVRRAGDTDAARGNMSNKLRRQAAIHPQSTPCAPAFTRPQLLNAQRSPSADVHTCANTTSGCYGERRGQDVTATPNAATTASRESLSPARCRSRAGYVRASLQSPRSPSQIDDVIQNVGVRKGSPLAQMARSAAQHQQARHRCEETLDSIARGGTDGGPEKTTANARPPHSPEFYRGLNSSNAGVNAGAADKDDLWRSISSNLCSLHRVSPSEGDRPPQQLSSPMLPLEGALAPSSRIGSPAIAGRPPRTQSSSPRALPVGPARADGGDSPLGVRLRALMDAAADASRRASAGATLRSPIKMQRDSEHGVFSPPLRHIYGDIIGASMPVQGTTSEVMSATPDVVSLHVSGDASTDSSNSWSDEPRVPLAARKWSAEPETRDQVGGQSLDMEGRGGWGHERNGGNERCSGRCITVDAELPPSRSHNGPNIYKTGDVHAPTIANTRRGVPLHLEAHRYRPELCADDRSGSDAACAKSNAGDRNSMSIKRGEEVIAPMVDGRQNNEDANTAARRVASLARSSGGGDETSTNEMNKGKCGGHNRGVGDLVASQDVAVLACEASTSHERELRKPGGACCGSVAHVQDEALHEKSKLSERSAPSSRWVGEALSGVASKDEAAATQHSSETRSRIDVQPTACVLGGSAQAALETPVTSQGEVTKQINDLGHGNHLAQMGCFRGDGPSSSDGGALEKNSGRCFPAAWLRRAAAGSVTGNWKEKMSIEGDTSTGGDRSGGNAQVAVGLAGGSGAEANGLPWKTAAQPVDRARTADGLPPAVLREKVEQQQKQIEHLLRSLASVDRHRDEAWLRDEAPGRGRRQSFGDETSSLKSLQQYGQKSLSVSQEEQWQVDVRMEPLAMETPLGSNVHRAHAPQDSRSQGPQPHSRSEYHQEPPPRLPPAGTIRVVPEGKRGGNTSSPAAHPPLHDDNDAPIADINHLSRPPRALLRLVDDVERERMAVERRANQIAAMGAEAEAEAERIRTAAMSEAQRLRAEAEAEAQRVRAAASAEAARARAEARSAAFEAERSRAEASRVSTEAAEESSRLEAARREVQTELQEASEQRRALSRERDAVALEAAAVRRERAVLNDEKSAAMRAAKEAEEEAEAVRRVLRAREEALGRREASVETRARVGAEELERRKATEESESVRALLQIASLDAEVREGFVCAAALQRELTADEEGLVAVARELAHTRGELRRSERGSAAIAIAAERAQALCNEFEAQLEVATVERRRAEASAALLASELRSIDRPLVSSSPSLSPPLVPVSQLTSYLREPYHRAATLCNPSPLHGISTSVNITPNTRRSPHPDESHDYCQGVSQQNSAMHAALTAHGPNRTGAVNVDSACGPMGACTSLCSGQGLAPPSLPSSALMLHWEVARLEQEVKAARAAAAAAQRNAVEAEAIAAEQQADFTLRLQGERQRLEAEHQEEMSRLLAQWAAEQEAAAHSMTVALLGDVEAIVHEGSPQRSPTITPTSKTAAATQGRI